MERPKTSLLHVRSPQGRPAYKINYHAFNASDGRPSPLWCTPRHSDWLGQRRVPDGYNRHGISSDKSKKRTYQTHLSQFVLYFSEPRPPETHIVCVEWMEMLMGFPVGYTDIL